MRPSTLRLLSNRLSPPPHPFRLDDDARSDAFKKGEELLKALFGPRPPRSQEGGDENEDGNQPPLKDDKDKPGKSRRKDDSSEEDDPEIDKENDGEDQKAARAGALKIVNASRRAQNLPPLAELPNSPPPRAKIPRRMKPTDDQKAGALRIINSGRVARGLEPLDTLPTGRW